MPNLISPNSTWGQPAVEVYYGGQRLYPAPMIDFSREIVRNSANTALSQIDSYTLKGIYVNVVSGYYHTIVSGMDTLRSIFLQDGLELQIKAGGGSTTLPSGTLITSGIYPFVQRIGIPSREDQWQRFDYEVELVSRISVSGVSGTISSSTDSWECTEDTETGSSKLTHRVSAVGINTSSGTSNALTNAKLFISGKLGTAGLTSGVLPAFISPPSGNADFRLFELTRSRNESFDNEAGSYEVTEVYVLTSGTLPYTHSRTYEFNRAKDGIITVSLQGTVQGLGRTDGNNVAYNGFYQAQSGFIGSVQPLFISDASGLYLSYGGSGILAVNNPQSKSITENRFLGTVVYSISYTDDPGEILPSGIAEQSLTIRRVDPVELIVSHTIPQRRLGNILQRIGTPTPGTITITATVKAISTGNPTADTNTAIAYAQTLINQNRPNEADFITLRLTDVSQEPDKLKLTVNASVTYEFTSDLISVQSPNTDILLHPVV